LVT
ncbi:hypothetical protein VCHENC02_3458B, partial [Vibrio harveyi]|jgi:choline dehydrogenase-like flavoprotein